MAAHKIIGHKAPNSASITLSGILARLRTRKCDTGARYFVADSSSKDGDVVLGEKSETNKHPGFKVNPSLSRILVCGKMGLNRGFKGVKIF